MFQTSFSSSHNLNVTAPTVRIPTTHSLPRE
jgi:hypothetical protein